MIRLRSAQHLAAKTPTDGLRDLLLNTEVGQNLSSISPYCPNVRLSSQNTYSCAKDAVVDRTRAQYLYGCTRNLVQELDLWNSLS